MVFKQEFEHMLLYGDEDGVEETTLHSDNFIPMDIVSLNSDLNKYLTLYVFFIGTFVWFNEVLSHFVKDGIEEQRYLALIASVSYTASFVIGYFNLLTIVSKKWSMAFYILLTFF